MSVITIKPNNELRSDKIDGKYILVRNSETREAVAMFKFDWGLHSKLVDKTHKSWDITNYDYSPLTESEVQTFELMKVIPLIEQESVYEVSQTLLNVNNLSAK